MGRSCLRNVWLSFLVVSSLICIVFNTEMQIPSKKTKNLKFFCFGPDGQAGRRSSRTQMPLCGNRFKLTTSPRVTLSLWKKSWLVVRDSWLVKAGHYIRMGCGQISQRDALWASPTHKADGRAFLPVAVSFSIACMRYRRGRLKGVPPWILGTAGIYDDWHAVVIPSWVCRGGTPHLNPRKNRSSWLVKAHHYTRIGYG